MEALALLRLIGEIKGGTRADVVDMPTVEAVVIPGHAGLKLSFKMCHQLLSSACLGSWLQQLEPMTLMLSEVYYPRVLKSFEQQKWKRDFDCQII